MLAANCTIRFDPNIQILLLGDLSGGLTHSYPIRTATSSPLPCAQPSLQWYKIRQLTSFLLSLHSSTYILLFFFPSYLIIVLKLSIFRGSNEHAQHLIFPNKYARVSTAFKRFLMLPRSTLISACSLYPRPYFSLFLSVVVLFDYLNTLQALQPLDNEMTALPKKSLSQFYPQHSTLLFYFLYLPPQLSPFPVSPISSFTTFFLFH